MRGTPGGNPHVIIIRLRDHRRIRSPELASKSQALAVRGEIVRRLNIAPDAAKPADSCTSLLQ